MSQTEILPTLAPIPTTTITPSTGDASLAGDNVENPNDVDKADCPDEDLDEKDDTDTEASDFPDPESDTNEPTDPLSWADEITSQVTPEDVEDDSQSRREWLRMNAENNEENPALDQLMAMVGLEGVKAHFLAVKKMVEAGEALQDLKLHLVLHGKNGTGKRTISKLYAQFLVHIGAVRQTRGSLYGRFPHPCEAKKIKSQMRTRSVIFCSVNNETDQFQLDVLLERLQSGFHPPVIILSTRDESLLKKIEDNPDGRDFFQTLIRLPDYTEEELKQLLLRIAARDGIAFEASSASTCHKILVQRALQEERSEDKYESSDDGSESSDDQSEKSDGFCMIHALQKKLQEVCKRRELRLQKENPNEHDHESAECSLKPRIELTIEDVLRPFPKNVKAKSEAWKKLQAMVGLERVKEECAHMVALAQINYQLRQLGKEPLKLCLNRTFVGPPGVGKTTVAKLYGQLVIDLGLVSGDDVLAQSYSDLLGGTPGFSEKKTAELLEEAEGQVLIIDDAHVLGVGQRESTYRKAAIATIVAKVSAEPEDRCIILVGYEEEMEQMFLNENKGLQRRFPKEMAIKFDAYTEDELCQILELKMHDSGLSMSDEAKEVSRQALSRMRINPMFGNAGDVENLLNLAKVRCLKEATSSLTGSNRTLMDSLVLQPHHIDPEWNLLAEAADRREKLFAGLVGLDQIITQFEGYELLVKGLRLHGMDPRPHVSWAFTFVGPPGTGKTTMARKIGQIYQDLRLLHSSEVVICSATDLIGTYKGWTGPKTRRVLESALGKVLLIDEAYRLVGDNESFQSEAVGEIVDAMTRDRYLNNMVIILAGYSEEMELLMQTNPGLRSRFSQRITFPPMQPQACLTHMVNTLRESNITLVPPPQSQEGEDSKAHRLLRKLAETKGWANARDVETISRNVLGAVYMMQGKLGKTSRGGSLRVTLEDVEPFMMDMLKERKAHGGDYE